MEGCSDVKFSVLITVYKKDKPSWFKEALISIYENQTIKPSEIVLVKDGPISEEIRDIIKNFLRVYPLKIVELPRNMGLAAALNKGLKQCTYDLVARMDSDDVSLPNRFELQLKALKENPNAVVVGGYIEEFDEDMKISYGVRKVPLNSKDILKFAKKRSPFNHMTVMIKRSIVLKEGGYPNFIYAQDYALWIKLLMKGYFCINIPYILVKARAGPYMVLKRSGFKYIKNELKLLKYFKDIGFYTYKDLALWGLIRFSARMLPNFFLEKIYYEYLRERV